MSLLYKLVGTSKRMLTLMATGIAISLPNFLTISMQKQLGISLPVAIESPVLGAIGNVGAIIIFGSIVLRGIYFFQNSRCPECGKLIEGSTNICPECGAEFDNPLRE